MYVILQGSRAGEVAHARYFQLKGWDAKKRRMWLDGLKAEYLRYVIIHPFYFRRRNVNADDFVGA